MPSDSRKDNTILKNSLENTPQDENRNTKQISNTERNNVEIANSQKAISWMNKIDSAYTDLWRNSEQQTVPRSKRFLRLFTASLSVPICGVMGLILILLGIYIFLHNNYIQELTVSYEYEDGDTPIEFTIQERMNPPIYLYYELENFYGNTRLYVRDAPDFIYLETTCAFINTNKDAVDLRTINGRLTLPELERDILTNQKIFPDNNLTYPCGLASASIFNDIPKIVYEDENEILIEITDLENDWDIVQYLLPNSSLSGYQPWHLTYRKDYRIWLHPAFTSNFRKPFGVINVPLEAGNYKMILLKNLWPSTQWNAKKAFTFSTISLAGGKNSFLFYSLVATGGAYILFALFLLVLTKSHYVIIDKTYKIVDLPELRR